MPKQNSFFTKGRVLVIAIIIVLVLLITSLIFLFTGKDKGSASSPDNVISGGETQVIALGDGTAKGDPFELSNLFPGDYEYKNFILNIKNDGVLAVTVGSDVFKSEGPLIDVLQVDIRRTDAEEALYEGLLKDMPSGIRVPVEESEESVSLTVTVMLDTSVGNEFLNSEVQARFNFWVAEEDLIPTVGVSKPKQVWPIVLGATASAGGLGAFIWWLLLFLLRRKKEEEAVKGALDGDQGGV